MYFCTMLAGIINASGSDYLVKPRFRPYLSFCSAKCHHISAPVLGSGPSKQFEKIFVSLCIGCTWTRYVLSSFLDGMFVFTIMFKLHYKGNRIILISRTMF